MNSKIMNICYISNSAAPSSNANSLQIAKLCEFLAKKGNNVTLIKPDTGLKTNFYKFYNIKKKYSVISLKYFNKFPLGINYYLYSILSIFCSGFNKQDIFITRNFFISFILCILRRNHIIEIHDDIVIEGRIVNYLVKKFKFLNNKSVIKVITTTETLKKRYISFCKVNQKKITVLHNGSSLKPKFKNYKYKPKNLNIGYFGSIYKSRGLDTILKISKKDINNKYYIYGGTATDIKTLKRNKSYKNIYFKEYIPFSKIPIELKKIDVCLLPYKSKVTVAGNVSNISKYTSPLKIFDYMITGKLIVCSNLKVIREVLINKKNSILVSNFKNEKVWISKIKDVNKNFLKYKNIRMQAYIYAKIHNIDWRVEKILDLIKNHEKSF